MNKKKIEKINEINCTKQSFGQTKNYTQKHNSTKFYKIKIANYWELGKCTEQFDKTEQTKIECIHFHGLGSYSAIEF